MSHAGELAWFFRVYMFASWMMWPLPTSSIFCLSSHAGMKQESIERTRFTRSYRESLSQNLRHCPIFPPLSMQSVSHGATGSSQRMGKGDPLGHGRHSTCGCRDGQVPQFLITLSFSPCRLFFEEEGVYSSTEVAPRQPWPTTSP